MSASDDIRYSTAVEGLQTIAGGDGDAADIAVHTLDMLRLLTEQPEKPVDDRRHGIYEMPDGSRFHSGTGEVSKPEAVETGEPVAWEARRKGIIQALEQIAGEAVETGEPVAWRWREPGLSVWWVSAEKPTGVVTDSEVQPLYASPVPDGEARRKALEEAAKIATTWREWLHEQPGAIGLGQAIAAQILAAIPTAGDATNGQ